MDKELSIKIQANGITDADLSKKFAVALHTMADYLEREKKVPKNFGYKHDGIEAKAEVQATASYFNAIERQWRKELEIVNNRLTQDNLSEDDRKTFEKIKSDLEAALDGLEYDEL